MGISHSWNGTVLTITSDSGTSSADLKGDIGIRGPQGPAGVIEGEVNVDLSNYYTKEETNAVASMFATKDEIDTAIDNAISSLDVPNVDLSNYYTKEETNAVASMFATKDEIDNAKAFYVTITGSNGVYSADKTIAETLEAGLNGCSVYCLITADENGTSIEQGIIPITRISNSRDLIVFSGLIYNVSVAVAYSTSGITVMFENIVTSNVIPEKLPNPYKLTFSGAVTGEYDGVTDVNINIPTISGATGKQGKRGTGILTVTTPPNTVNTSSNGVSYKHYVFENIKVMQEAKVDEILEGDTIRLGSSCFKIDYITAAYTYCDQRISIQGEQGIPGVAQTPLFANTIEECTDTSKVYVLPDGYIYAYMEGKPIPTYTNRLPLATDATGAIYNASSTRGYAKNTRYSTSSGESTAAGWDLTGFIPCKRGDIIRFKNVEFLDISGDGGSYVRCGVYAFNSSYEYLTNTGGWTLDSLPGDAWAAEYGENGDLIQLTIPSSWSSSVAYARFCCGNLDSNSVITVNEEIIDGEPTDSWQNTGFSFVPANYEDRIIELEEKAEEQKADAISLTNRVTVLENAEDGIDIPEYWITALEEGTQEINTAITEAGYNKSAFLFYSDVHWNYGSMLSPTLLKYLYNNTAINKTIFGGDIVNNEATDYETMSYLWEWRKQLKDLPNHHSVVGNHDDGNSTNNLFSEQYVYGYLLAAEETPDIVRGDDGMYYYIDNSPEKTRYLYLDTAYKGATAAQQAFIKNALITTPSGWHIVVIAHIWYYPDYDQIDVKPIPIKGYGDSASVVISMLDNYNSRIGDYANCGGKVEFCIGGHVHIDYDGVTTTGIPIILVETDSKHIRSTYTYTAKTTTEASVNAIIADYDNNVIKVIRVGRGNSREVTINN